MRSVRTYVFALLTLVTIGLGSATPAAASTVGPGGGDGCTAFATISFTSTTATAHVAGTDKCVYPAYYLKMQVGLNTETSGGPHSDVVRYCPTNINNEEACAEAGLSASTTNPPGIQTWSFCGYYYYISSIDFRSVVLTRPSCASARG